MAIFTGSGKVLATRRSLGKRTRDEIRNTKRFEGVRTPRHQIRCRLDVFIVTRYHDLGEVEIIQEVQQTIYSRADVYDTPQLERPGKFG